MSGKRAASISLETLATGFEYLLVDPLLSDVLAAESINGIQGEDVISTIKHYSLNCIETNRHWLDAFIDPAALRRR